MKLFEASLLLSIPSLSAGQSVLLKEHVKHQPYTRYLLETASRDTITCYLTEFNKEERLPLIVYIQGSGYQSLFYLDADGNTRPAAGHISLAYLVQQKAKLLVIEKPGVQFTDNREINPDFDKKFSLDSWGNTIITCIKFIKENEKIDNTKLLVIGHSEGGLVAARVTALLDNVATHTAILAGEGPSQLYSLYRFAENGVFFNDGYKSAPKRLDSLLSEWNKIGADPLSVKNKFWGLTYLRWSSFLKTSVYEELAGFEGQILIVQGEADKNVYPESAKILYTGLLSKNRKVKLTMVPHADHSFNLENNKSQNGWDLILRQCLTWAGF